MRSITTRVASKLQQPHVPVQNEWIAIDPARHSLEHSDLIANQRSGSRRWHRHAGDRMLDPDIAPQSTSPAIELLAERSRAEILARYRKLRAISTAHNRGALKRVSRDALIEQAHRLGVIRRRMLVLNTQDEFALVYDLVLYSRQGDRKRPLDRYASSQRLSPDSDEARVLDAMLAARFALIRVERRHPRAGLIVTDLIRGNEFWLVDQGMEATAPVGFTLATRVHSPEDFHMAAGVFVPVDRALLTSALQRRPLLTRMALKDSLEDRRFAEALYREAIEAGVMERVRFEDPPDWRGLGASSVADEWPAIRVQSGLPSGKSARKAGQARRRERRPSSGRAMEGREQRT